ncbi:hypothetical protein IUY40_16720 [Flavobacterium sp. ALJ2]|uniref:hypothetical protein n=1 Tax=Flavobacterium sp. ALJ2 TaxID=2786960 RepID=UPI0018A0DB48|nr:hypothetical protein [Flavobacterium sp. ALJ2]MBF7093177.1 hypothetical protein [Flavobacterium sp. ALJ2]
MEWISFLIELAKKYLINNHFIVIVKLIGDSSNLIDFNNGLKDLVTKWKIDEKLLPPFIN